MAKIVAANWKMNLRLETAAGLARRLAADGRSCWLFPATVHLAAVAATRGALKLGAQDVSPSPDGAFTGDVSAEMLADAGCTMALVGHSERRQLHGENGDLLLRKLRRAIEGGLQPLYCVGETAAQRDGGRAEKVVRAHLALLKKLAPEMRAKVCAVAYEPVWAIGTGVNATPEQAQQMHALARAELRKMGLEAVPVLYGGSVKPDNAGALLACADVDGLLVGGASLDYENLAAIDDAARGASK
jgi:triosephosphate isomerase